MLALVCRMVGPKSGPPWNPPASVIARLHCQWKLHPSCASGGWETSTSTHVYIYIYVYIFTYIYIFMLYIHPLYIHIYIYVYICIYMYIYICACVYMFFVCYIKRALCFVFKGEQLSHTRTCRYQAFALRDSFSLWAGKGHPRFSSSSA